jgi:diacylglycerol kinase family enzyme
LIPLGSGNDFARACGLHYDVEQTIRLLKEGAPKSIDIGQVSCVEISGKGISRYFINECSLGMGPEVVRRMEKSGRAWGPSLGYLKSILSTFLFHRPQEVHCKTSGWEWKGKARVVAVANGRSFGKGIYIAPNGEVDDGSLNTFIAGDVPLIRFLLYLQTLKKKAKLSDPNVYYESATAAQLSAPETCSIEADGELLGYLPATISIVPGKIKFYH